MRILGIETSCDESAVAVLDEQRGLLAHELWSQIDLHRAFGGVVPELASRDHLRRLLPLLRTALERHRRHRVHGRPRPGGGTADGRGTGARAEFRLEGAGDRCASPRGPPAGADAGDTGTAV